MLYVNLNKKKNMSFAEKHIVETYAGLFEGLSSISKIQLIQSLSKSLKNEKKTRERNFYKSFGAFASDKSPEEIVNDIRSSRKFRKKDIEL